MLLRYQAMLWGWIDTIKSNYPCLPPDFSSSCLQWDSLEVLFSAVDRADEFVAAGMWGQAWNLRLGSEGLRTPDLLYQAVVGPAALDSSAALPTLVEIDSWRYQTYNVSDNYGIVSAPAMVCDVLVCNIWKAGGLFGANSDTMQCGEMTNWDAYVLNFFDPPLQILGKYTMGLNNVSSKEPYPHYAETCATLAPDYNKEADC